jgi:hypothetical protein
MLVERHPHHEEMIEAFFARWTEMLNGPIHGTVAILETLHERRVPLYALTNWSAETWRLARPLFPFLDRFRGILVRARWADARPDLSPAVGRLRHPARQRFTTTAGERPAVASRPSFPRTRGPARLASGHRLL